MNEGSSNKLGTPTRISHVAGTMTVFIGLGIIFIGIRESLQSGVAARAFGVPLLDSRDGDLLAIKAARDEASGIQVLTFLGLRQRSALSYTMGVLTLIPLSTA